MQVNVKQLDAHLRDQLSSMYLVSANEIFLADEARAKIVNAAHAKGYNEKKILHVERGFSWTQFDEAYQNQSLFAEKTIIDVRYPHDKLDATARKHLLQFIERPPHGVILTLTTHKLTAAEQKTAWFKAFNQLGVYLPIWPISMQELPRWISDRAKTQGISVDADTPRLIALYSEGNLHAANQALEKLALSYPNKTVTLEMTRSILSDNAVFNIFDLSDHLLSGNVKRVVRILRGLEAQGDEAILVLWALSKDVRLLIQMLTDLQQGKSMQVVLARTWQSKKPYFQAALKRVKLANLYSSLKKLAQADAVIKGLQPGNPWALITSAVLPLCHSSAQ